MNITAAVAQDGPHNHWCCRDCDGSKPLTLADRELITGRSIVAFDDETGTPFCGDCLADLPAGFDALFHVCGEEPAEVAPVVEPAVVAIPAPVATPAKPRKPRVGDAVYYSGTLTEYHGVWEVTLSDSRGLVLFDLDRALWNVAPDSVTVVGRKASRRSAKGA